MAEERLVRDEVTRCGQHWLEVVRMGERVEPDAWMMRAPHEAQEYVRCYERYEPGLDVWRLYVRWPAREVVRLMDDLHECVGEEAVLWYLGANQTVRNGLFNAAACWWLERQMWPVTGWVWMSPPVERLQLEDAARMGEGQVWMALRQALWIPKGYVMVGGK